MCNNSKKVLNFHQNPAIKSLYVHVHFLSVSNSHSIKQYETSMLKRIESTVNELYKEGNKLLHI